MKRDSHSAVSTNFMDMTFTGKVFIYIILI